MIPLFARLHFGGAHGPRFRLLLPLFIVWLLLLPFVVLLAVPAALLVACFGVNPFRLAGACWQILAAFRGTHVEVIDGPNLILVSLH